MSNLAQIPFLYDFLKDEYELIDIKDLALLKDKIILITGSNGLIGCNLVNILYFLNQKYSLNLRILAHSYSKKEDWLPNKNIKYFSGNLDGFIDSFDESLDFVFHCATNVAKKIFANDNGIADESSVLSLNTTTLWKLLKLSYQNKAKFLFCSTSSVYGKIPASSAKEEFNGDVDLQSFASLYGEAKRLGEVICQNFIKFGMDIKIARIAIGYGAGVKVNDERMINEFCKRAISDGILTMRDRGGAVRQIGFISDICEMLINVLLSGKSVVYNVSGDDTKAVSVRQIAEQIGRILDVEVRIPDTDNGVAGAQNSVIIDVSKYCNEFGKNSFVDLETGLGKTALWYEMMLRGKK